MRRGALGYKFAPQNDTEEAFSELQKVQLPSAKYGWRQRRKDEETSRGLHFPIALHP
jgi:hypothetical protein